MTLYDARGNDIEDMKEMQLLRRYGADGYFAIKLSEAMPLRALEVQADIVDCKKSWTPEAIKERDKKNLTCVFFAPGVLEKAVKGK